MKFILILCSFLTYSLFGQVLILQFSDTHSAYDNIETFTQNVTQQINDFKDIHPHGEVLFIHSGDISGVSEFTHIDRGSSNYDYFAAITKDHHFTLTMGNHDGADWSFETFMDQVKYFEKVMKENGKPDWSMLAANIKTKAPQLSKYFKSYQDIRLKNGKRVRVVGLVLDELFSYSSDWLGENLEITTMLETAKKQYLKASTDGVDRIIFSAHEELNKPNMQMFEKELSAWLEKKPQLNQIKHDLMFSAHDHTVQIYEGVQSSIVSSGSAYNFISQTTLDEDLNIISRPQHVEASKAVPGAPLSLKAKLAVEMIKSEIQKTNELNNKIIANNPVKLAIRGAVKLGPHHNGIIVANAFRDWAKSEVNPNKVIDYTAFFNSGSYRGSESIGPGDFTYGDAKKIAPFPNKAKIFIAKGEHIQSAFEGLRINMGNEHTPQISSNFREIPLGSNTLYRFDKASNRWVLLEKNGYFAIALDGWLGKNGFKIEAFENLIHKSKYIASQLEHESEVLVKFLPQIFKEEALKIEADCNKLYKP